VSRGVAASKAMTVPDAEGSIVPEGDDGLSVDLLEEK
jgi:hypothetical protein